jgi:hypothetical protein
MRVSIGSGGRLFAVTALVTGSLQCGRVAGRQVLRTGLGRQAPAKTDNQDQFFGQL